jgi:hypothetical protein
MFSNLFIDINYAEIVKRLERVKTDSPRMWGTMTPAQMLRHCRAQIEFILNPSDSVKVYPTLFRYAPIRWIALYGISWPKNSKTAPELDVNKKLNDTSEFENEHRLILKALQDLYLCPEVEAIHPLFGKMGKTQWGRVVWKHLNHHLKQFGV